MRLSQHWLFCLLYVLNTGPQALFNGLNMYSWILPVFQFFFSYTSKDAFMCSYHHDLNPKDECKQIFFFLFFNIVEAPFKLMCSVTDMWDFHFSDGHNVGKIFWLVQFWP